MLGRVLETLLRSMNLGQVGVVEPVPTPEPDYARKIAEFVLRWKRCPRCHKLWSIRTQDLEFLNTNRNLFSESYRTICQDGHRLFVTIFPTGTAQMFTYAQDEITAFLPQNCGPNRRIRTIRVSPAQGFRGGNELTFIRGCGVSGHDHDEYSRYYEKPGWETHRAYY